MFFFFFGWQVLIVVTKNTPNTKLLVVVPFI